MQHSGLDKQMVTCFLSCLILSLGWFIKHCCVKLWRHRIFRYSDQRIFSCCISWFHDDRQFGRRGCSGKRRFDVKKSIVAFLVLYFFCTISKFMFPYLSVISGLQRTNTWVKCLIGMDSWVDYSQIMYAPFSHRLCIYQDLNFVLENGGEFPLLRGIF